MWLLPLPRCEVGGWGGEGRMVTDCKVAMVEAGVYVKRASWAFSCWIVNKETLPVACVFKTKSATIGPDGLRSDERLGIWFPRF